MQVLQVVRRLSRAAHAEPCHLSEGCNNNVGGHCRKCEPQRKLVMLGVSLRARWDATLVMIIIIPQFRLYVYKTQENHFYTHIIERLIYAVIHFPMIVLEQTVLQPFPYINCCK